MAITSRLQKRLTAVRVLAATAAVSSLLLVTACGGSEAEAGAGEGDYGTLDLNLSWIKNAEFAGEYFADTNGYYDEAGFSEVNLIAGGPGGTSSETMVLSGGALVGTSSPMGVAPVIVEEDAPLKIIGTTYQKNPFAIVSLDGNPITAPADLEGKRIGVQAGVNETLFDALMEVNGIDPSSLEKVPVQYDPQPLINGDVDGFFGYLTNEVLTLELSGHKTAVLPFADNGLPFIAESFVTTDENIETRRDELKAFLRATLRGWKDAVADPDESARLAVEVYGADLNLDLAKEKMQAEEQNSKLVVTEETEANGLFTISDELIEDNLAILKLAGYDLAKEDVFDLSLLAEVYEENPELK
ncbi:ABC transporter substrate-binding protein [Arthrobacter sp. 7Tela_A1]|uniref:ABC transporter substrate-binding protein n=1 Tax=Arthrobacter sp. 7Tela_A1 TaxID=3093745 RepID=UPI003BB539D3